MPRYAVGRTRRNYRWLGVSVAHEVEVEGWVAGAWHGVGHCWVVVVGGGLVVVAC